MSLLQVSGISKSYGGVKALDSIAFEMSPGELLALAGPNGAGKTTLFNVINGQIKPDRGSVRLDAIELVGLLPTQVWRRGVSRTFQISQIFLSLSAVENVQMTLLSADRRLLSPWEKAASYKRSEALFFLEQVGLKLLADKSCSELAYADLKRVELAVAISNEPKLLLMDEPTAGMWKKERQNLMALIKALAIERQMAVLFTEHSMDVIFSYADRMIVLASGQLVAVGAPTDIRRDRKIQELYFGSGKICKVNNEVQVA